MSETVTITLEPEGEGPPAATRIKRALKDLLRRHKLRCISIEPRQNDGSPLEKTDCCPHRELPDSASPFLDQAACSPAGSRKGGRDATP